jgi:hypothetical protein
LKEPAGSSADFSANSSSGLRTDLILPIDFDDVHMTNVSREVHIHGKPVVSVRDGRHLRILFELFNQVPDSHFWGKHYRNGICPCPRIVQELVFFLLLDLRSVMARGLRDTGDDWKHGEYPFVVDLNRCSSNTINV